jgi:hypothetical protein
MGSSNFSSNDWESENHGVWGTLDLQGDGGTKVAQYSDVSDLSCHGPLHVGRG